ncbi:hypothetical protein ACWKSP_15140 [Micromonosporaceae bacterium Da 78-11]
MDDDFSAYCDGRADGIAGCRDDARTEDPATGADYRTGFLDGRIELFRMFAQVRKIADDDPGN